MHLRLGDQGFILSVKSLNLPSGLTHVLTRLQPVALGTLTSQLCSTAPPAAFAILLGCRAGHCGSERPEEAVITGCANTAATLNPPGRTAAAEAAAGCDQAHLLFLSTERSPGGSLAALAMAMHMWEQ